MWVPPVPDPFEVEERVGVWVPPEDLPEEGAAGAQHNLQQHKYDFERFNLI